MRTIFKISLWAAGASLLAGLVLRRNMEQNQPQNKAVREAFDAWAAGTGGPFSLLADDAQWTIEGNSLAAGTYQSREEFMQKVIRPFNARMRTGLVPKIRQLHTDKDTVIVLFDAEGVAIDGKPYRNTYSWYLRFRGAKIIEAHAFFDSIAFNDLWQRVPQ